MVPARSALIQLGECWVAEEALAIGLYCALAAPDLETGIIVAVNHGGDSDYTGSIAGNLLGAMHGEAAIPARWLAGLELKEVIGAMADDLAAAPQWQLGWGTGGTPEVEFYWDRYPGH